MRYTCDALNNAQMGDTEQMEETLDAMDVSEAPASSSALERAGDVCREFDPPLELFFSFFFSFVFGIHLLMAVANKSGSSIPIMHSFFLYKLFFSRAPFFVQL